MLLKLLILFTVVPLLELWLLIEVGKIIGTFLTIFLVASTGFFGMLLARSQGLQVLYRLQRELQHGGLPGDEILDGVCILLGGSFLLTPGILTDLLGFSLLVPFTREIIKHAGKRLLEKRMQTGTIYIYRRP